MCTDKHVEDLKKLHLLCQKGMLYEVEQWIRDGQPLQLDPDVEIRGYYRSALEIALETGQHSLCVLLLRSGYRLDLERDSPLSIALGMRRWDLLDLLLEHGADPHKADLESLLDTYQTELYERFHAMGVDFTKDHALADSLAYHTSNKPLYGFVKRHRDENPGFQRELDMALGYHVRKGKEKGIMLCLWAGADPHAGAPDLEYGRDDDSEEDYRSAVHVAASWDNVWALRRFKPDPEKIDFDELYRAAGRRDTVEFLAGIKPPCDLIGILSRMSWAAGCSWRRRAEWKNAMLAVLTHGKRWEHAEKDVLADMRRNLLRASDWALENFLRELSRPEFCSPEIFHELTRTPTMQKRMLEMRLIKPPVKPVSKVEKERREIANFLRRYDRQKLYEEVWSRPVTQVARSYGVCNVYIARACRALRVPTPPRGYWAKVRSGKPVRRVPLRELPKRLRWGGQRAR